MAVTNTFEAGASATLDAIKDVLAATGSKLNFAVQIDGIKSISVAAQASAASDEEYRTMVRDRIAGEVLI